MPPSFIFKIVMPLFIFPGVLVGCKKNKNDGPDYTGKIGGIRHWHGTYSYQEDRPITDSTYYYTDTSYGLPDTSFAVTIINRNTIKVFGSNFSFKETDSTKDILYFGTAYYGMDGYVVKYFYNKDSIVYSFNDPGIYFSDQTVYHTY